jgi:hypothetical protein
MDMILVGIHNLKVECRVFLERFIETFLEFRRYIVFQVFSAMFGTPNDMVRMLVNTVIQPSSSHEESVPGVVTKVTPWYEMMYSPPDKRLAT